MSTISKISKMCVGCGGFIRYSTQGKKIEWCEEVGGYVCSVCRPNLIQKKREFFGTMTGKQKGLEKKYGEDK